jgi:hypothetical protein
MCFEMASTPLSLTAFMKSTKKGAPFETPCIILLEISIKLQPWGLQSSSEIPGLEIL